jgi:catechol 2,3-dioxygenase-like lactoylglutathione lyase family enzyme
VDDATILAGLVQGAVDDQDKSLKFYTEALGFEKSKGIPLGAFKWLTVVSLANTAGSSNAESCFAVSPGRWGRRRSPSSTTPAGI